MRKQSARMLLLSRPQGGERDGGTEAGISTANVSASMSALKEAAQADAQAAVEDLESWMEQEEDRIQKMERVAEFSLIESFYQQEVESQRNVIIKKWASAASGTSSSTSAGAGLHEELIKTKEQMLSSAAIASNGAGSSIQGGTRSTDDILRTEMTRMMIVNMQESINQSNAYWDATREARESYSRAKDFFLSMTDKKRKDLLRRFKRESAYAKVRGKILGTPKEVELLKREQHKVRLDLELAHLDRSQTTSINAEATYLEKQISVAEELAVFRQKNKQRLSELQMRHAKDRHSQMLAREAEMRDTRARLAANVSRVKSAGIRNLQDEELATLDSAEDVQIKERKKAFESGVSVSVYAVFDSLWHTVSGDLMENERTSNHSSSYRCISTASSRSSMHSGAKNDKRGALVSGLAFIPSHEGEEGEEEEEELWPIGEGDNENELLDLELRVQKEENVMFQNRILPLDDLKLQKEQQNCQSEIDMLARNHRKVAAEERLKNLDELSTLAEELAAAFNKFREGKMLVLQSLRQQMQEQRASLEAQQQAELKCLKDRQATELQELHATMELQEAEESRRQNVILIESEKRAQLQLSAHVFHEVRNALSSVIAMSDVIDAESASTVSMGPSEKEQLQNLAQQTREVVAYILSVLNSVLDIAKIQQEGAKVDKKVPVKVSKLLKSASRIQASNIRPDVNFFIHQPDGTDLYVWTDANVLLQLLVNLLTNAAKFTQRGAIELFAQVVPGATDESQCCVRFGVSDTGPGLSHKVITEAKDYPFSSPAISTGYIRSTGYGLHLAHLLAEALGAPELQHMSPLLNRRLGNMASRNFKAVVDNQGPGTCIWFDIPLEKHAAGGDSGHGAAAVPPLVVNTAAPVPMSSDSGSVAPIGASFSPSGTFHILIADDQTLIRKGTAHILINMFAKHGCSVVLRTACTGECAVREMKFYEECRGGFDLVICDNTFTPSCSSPSNKVAAVEDRESKPTLLYNSTKDGLTLAPEERRSHIAGVIREFFALESFAPKQGDGRQSGIDLVSAISTGLLPFHPPVMILVTGHEEVCTGGNILSILKPLKEADVVKLLQSSVELLVSVGSCTKDANGRLLTRRGNQLLVPTASEEPPAGVNHRAAAVEMQQSGG